jgi:hypothetical protein
MEVSTRDEWMEIGRQTAAIQPRVADRVLDLLRSLAEIRDGFVTDQLTHCLQTATLAERAGADDEVVVAALCQHDGKAISVANHPAIAAAILEPYVRPDVHFMIEVHQDFQGKHYYAHFGLDADARERYGVTRRSSSPSLRRRVGPEGLRPRLRHPAPRALRTQGPRPVRPGLRRQGDRVTQRPLARRG